jgi:hypothetical protein
MVKSQRSCLLPSISLAPCTAAFHPPIAVSAMRPTSRPASRAVALIRAPSSFAGSWGSLAILICSYFFDSQIFALEETILFQFLDEHRKTQSDGIKVTYDIDADAKREDIEALVAQSQKRSAVYDIITNPTNVTVVVS